MHTTTLKVRNLIPDLLIATDDIGTVASGTSITLHKPAVAVPTMLKDAAEIVITTNYTFVQPRAITLLVAASNENYIANCHLAFTDTELVTFIGESDRIIDNYFVNLTAPASEYLDDWSKYLTSSKVIRAVSKGNPDMLKWAGSMEKIAMDGMSEYLKRTSAGVFDDSAVTRSDATSVDAFNLDQQSVKTY